MHMQRLSSAAVITAVAIAIMSLTEAQASEQDELALVIRQLDQVQAGLSRAQVQSAADAGGQVRFYFDYARASADIRAMQDGITNYLQPSRAQPHLPSDGNDDISGQYRFETAGKPQ